MFMAPGLPALVTKVKAAAPERVLVVSRLDLARGLAARHLGLKFDERGAYLAPLFLQVRVVRFDLLKVLLYTLLFVVDKACDRFCKGRMLDRMRTVS